MLATKLPKLEIAKTMKLVGTSIQKRRDADNSIMVDVVATIIILSVKKLVSADANENNKRHHQHRQHHQHHSQAMMIWNNSDRNIVCCNQRQDHAVPDSSVTIMIAKLVFVMYLLTVDARAIKIILKRPKNAKINVETYKICALCHRFVDAVKKMLHAIIMINATMHAKHLNTADVVEIKIISIRKEIATNNVNADAQNRNNQKSSIQTSMMYVY